MPARLARLELDDVEDLGGVVDDEVVKAQHDRGALRERAPRPRPLRVAGRRAGGGDVAGRALGHATEGLAGERRLDGDGLRGRRDGGSCREALEQRRAHARRPLPRRGLGRLCAVVVRAMVPPVRARQTCAGASFASPAGRRASVCGPSGSLHQRRSAAAGDARAGGEQEGRGRARGYVVVCRGPAVPRRRGDTLMKMRTLAMLVAAAAGLAALPAACGVKVTEEATPSPAMRRMAARPSAAPSVVALRDRHRRRRLPRRRPFAHADAVGRGRRREAGGRDRRGQGRSCRRSTPRPRTSSRAARCPAPPSR